MGIPGLFLGLIKGAWVPCPLALAPCWKKVEIVLCVLAEVGKGVAACTRAAGQVPNSSKRIKQIKNNPA